MSDRNGRRMLTVYSIFYSVLPEIRENDETTRLDVQNDSKVKRGRLSFWLCPFVVNTGLIFNQGK